MNGYSPKLPLATDTVDGFFSLHKSPMETIKQDLKMLVLTNPGERVMIPDYGVGIKSLLFEQNSSNLKDTIKKRIDEQVMRYMDFIEILELDITDDVNNENMLNISILYYVPSINSRQNLIISLNT